MKKISAYIFSGAVFLLSAVLPLKAAEVFGGAILKKSSPDKILVTFPAVQGWPQLRIAIPPQKWGKGKVSFQARVIEPLDSALPGGICVLSEHPRNRIAARYIHKELNGKTPVTLEFAHKNGSAPGFLVIAAKNPTAPITLEISKIDVGKAAAPSTIQFSKQKLEPIKPLIFKGKPFFPLGAFDSTPIDASGKLGMIDPDFLAAGGNITEFGGLHLESAHDFATHGQPAIFAALEKISSDPAFADVALVIETGIEFFMRPATAEEKKHGISFVPLAEAERAAALKRYTTEVKRLAKYENIIGYTVDEPENCLHPWYSWACKDEWNAKRDLGLCGIMEEIFLPMQQIIHTHHPNAKTMPILAWWTTYKPAGNIYDVVIANEYPRRGKPDIEFASDLFIVNYDAGMAAAAARANGKTAIYMPPCFDNCPGNYRYLTIREQLYVMFAPLTRGCMGLHLWRLQRASDFHRKTVVYPAMKEVHKLKDFLLGEWCDELVISDHDTASADYLKSFAERSPMFEKVSSGKLIRVENPVPDVSYCLRKHPDGRYCLIAVNNRREPLEVQFRLAVDRLPETMIDSINASDRINVSGASVFTVKFEPFGVHAYIW